MNKFLVVTNKTKDPDGAFTGEVCRFLREQGADYQLPAEGVRSEMEKSRKSTPGGLHWEERPEDFSDGEKNKEDAAGAEINQVECILVLGGDGTVLRAAGRYHFMNVPFLGINLGTLGYLAEIEKANWKEALEQLLHGNYFIEQRMMIEGAKNFSEDVKTTDKSVNTKNFSGEPATERITGTEDSVQRKREEIRTGQESPENALIPEEKHTALNDIVIARNGALRIMNYDVRVNGQFLCTYNADGIIVSTPTGSTAYNLSAGGPIVEPGAEMIVLTPICPHQMNIRPIVLSANDTIEIVIGNTSRGAVLEAEADFDGNDRVDLKTGDKITICKSARTTRLVKLNNRSFLETLHKKMS